MIIWFSALDNDVWNKSVLWCVSFHAIIRKIFEKPKPPPIEMNPPYRDVSLKKNKKIAFDLLGEK